MNWISTTGYNIGESIIKQSTILLNGLIEVLFRSISLVMQNHPLERDLEAVGLSHCDVSTVFCQFILRSWISYHMSNLPSFHILKLFTNAYLCQGNQLSC